MTLSAQRQVEACFECPEFRESLWQSARAQFQEGSFAEDLVQQVMVEALQKSRSIGALGNPENWIWVVYKYVKRGWVRNLQHPLNTFEALTEYPYLPVSSNIEADLIERQERERKMEASGSGSLT